MYRQFEGVLHGVQVGMMDTSSMAMEALLLLLLLLHPQVCCYFVSFVFTSHYLLTTTISIYAIKGHRAFALCFAHQSGKQSPLQ